jgi:hypothetical protein
MKEFKRLMEFEKVCDESAQYGITIEADTTSFITVKAPNRPSEEFRSLLEATGYVKGLMAGIESKQAGDE